MKALSISKIIKKFGFAVPKILEIPSFVDSTQLFQKLWDLLSFLQFPVLKGTPERKLFTDDVTIEILKP